MNLGHVGVSGCAGDMGGKLNRWVYTVLQYPPTFLSIHPHSTCSFSPYSSDEALIEVDLGSGEGVGSI